MKDTLHNVEKQSLIHKAGAAIWGTAVLTLVSHKIENLLDQKNLRDWSFGVMLLNLAGVFLIERWMRKDSKKNQNKEKSTPNRTSTPLDYHIDNNKNFTTKINKERLQTPPEKQR